MPNVPIQDVRIKIGICQPCIFVSEVTLGTFPVIVSNAITTTKYRIT